MDDKVMSIWAIGDLHLSLGLSPAQAKPMDIFGEAWVDHAATIAHNWCAQVADNDVVLIPGDICWANKLEDAKATFEWLDHLPGRKILLRGNHDNWWQSITRLRAALPDGVYAIQNNVVYANGVAFCGARGWTYGEGDSLEHQEKMRHRERIRLETSLLCLPKKAKLRVALMHYPPFPAPCKNSEFVDLLLEHRIDLCVFGHLHGHEADKFTDCIIDKTKFVLASADYLDFSPVKLYNVGYKDDQIGYI